MNKPLFLITLILLSIILISTISMDGFADFEKKVSNYHIKNAAEDLDAANIVTTIVWDYRAYDTLGEETVLFTATLGIYALFKKYKRRKKKKKEYEFPISVPKIFGDKK